MKYIKSCLIITILMGVGYSQCSNANGFSNVLDIVALANCVLAGNCGG